MTKKNILMASLLIAIITCFASVNEAKALPQPQDISDVIYIANAECVMCKELNGGNTVIGSYKHGFDSKGVPWTVFSSDDGKTVIITQGWKSFIVKPRDTNSTNSQIRARVNENAQFLIASDIPIYVNIYLKDVTTHSIGTQVVENAYVPGDNTEHTLSGFIPEGYGSYNSYIIQCVNASGAVIRTMDMTPFFIPSDSIIQTPDIIVYPNPVSCAAGYITAKITNPSGFQVWFNISDVNYSSMGISPTTVTAGYFLNGDTYTIPINGLQPGIYYLSYKLVGSSSCYTWEPAVPFIITCQ